MSLAKLFSVGSALVLAVFMLVPAARAGVGNQSTMLTFNHSLRIPGHEVLPAGTYWFSVSNNMSPQNMVRIKTKNDKFIAAMLTVPVYRNTARAGTQLQFAYPSGDHAPVLLEWFYPGMHYGHAFVYSPKMENRLQTEVAKSIVARGNSNEG